MRYLAIDYGLKRTGLAICDHNEKITSPLAVIPSNDKLLDEIQQTIEREEVEAIVIGMPFNMDGSQGQQAKYVQAFAGKLETKSELPIYFQDERLSTFIAEEKLSSLKLKRNKKSRIIDAIAAAEILNAFLESKKE